MKIHALTTDIEVKISKNRLAKKLNLYVTSAGDVKLTIPYWISYKEGVRFVEQQETWVKNQLQKVIEAKLLRATPLDNKTLKKQRKEARKTIEAWVNHYCGLYQVSYNRLFIKDQKTLWGSCSAQKNLNLNWRITLAPAEIMKYVIVHEVCHLREMNHSAKFWQLVAISVPDYKFCRKWLQEEGKTLF